MRLEEREALLREGVSRAETPRERRELAGLVEDLRSSPLRGSQIPVRLRNFRSDSGSYLAALGGPLPYMVRLREIDELTADHEWRLSEARGAIWREESDPERRAARWRETVAGWSFDEVNDLIERHNRWFPVESRLPMDPKRGDYALVNGRDYRRRVLDAAWALELFPALTPAGVP